MINRKILTKYTLKLDNQWTVPSMHHWLEVDWLHCKRDALSGNRKVDGSRLTGSTPACHL